MPDAIISKYCPKCKRILPTSEFYKNRRRGDGLRSYCKTCTLAAVKAYQQSPAGKEYYRRYEQSSAGKESHRRYHKTEAGKERQGQAARKYRQSENGKEVEHAYRQSELAKDSKRVTASKQRLKYPDKVKARNAVNHAIEAGRIASAKQFKCQYCNKQAQQYHHWRGYAPEQWLDVIPVCRVCDYKVHRVVLAIC
jgi:hypothetical protein